MSVVGESSTIAFRTFGLSPVAGGSTMSVVGALVPSAGGGLSAGKPADTAASTSSISAAIYVSFAVALFLAAAIANLSQSIPITRSNLPSNAFAKNPAPQYA